MNQLQHETSPYLLQHANNPVNWYPWRDEALQKARREDKPILVSIGYSTCHWCHVMEHESFEDKDTADFMNQHFVNIKVDREERPDLDQIYMEACQAITGGGGWPLNCFLTPEGHPFYAGTYFPSTPAYNRPSWKQLLEYIIKVYQNDRPKVERQAEKMAKGIASADSIFYQNLTGDGDALFQTSSIDQIFTKIRQHFDAEHGGLSGAPKFPTTMVLRFLLEYAHHTGNEEARQHLILSVDKMISAGIYDQIGGGFARYATDKAWQIPHFEKMLYDNALLVQLISELHVAVPEADYERELRQTLAFIEREMMDPSTAAFYSALDADSEGEEGKFYVWQDKEIDQILGSEASLFKDYYGVTPGGNWEGKNILHRSEPTAVFAKKHSVSVTDFLTWLDQQHEKMRHAREQRVRPGLDDKILLSWNALMGSAYLRAYHSLKDTHYLDIAKRNASFLLRTFLQESGELWHTHKNGQSSYPGFLDDYASFSLFLLDLSEATQDTSYIGKAADLMDYCLQAFLDSDTNLFYFTKADQEDIPIRKREVFDNATPSGNSLALAALLRLSVVLDRRDYRETAERMLLQMREALMRYPSSFSNWVLQLQRMLRGVPEIAVVGPGAGETAAELQAHYLPGAILMATDQDDASYPLLRGKKAGAKTLIYVCKNYTCQAPTTSIKEAVDTIQTQQQTI